MFLEYTGKKKKDVVILGLAFKYLPSCLKISLTSIRLNYFN